MTETAEIQSQVESKQRSGLVQFFIRLFREKPLGTVGGVIVLLLLLVAIFAEWIAPFPYQEIHMADRLREPGAEYLLGQTSWDETCSVESFMEPVCPYMLVWGPVLLT